MLNSGRLGWCLSRASIASLSVGPTHKAVNMDMLREGAGLALVDNPFDFSVLHGLCPQHGQTLLSSQPPLMGPVSAHLPE